MLVAMQDERERLREGVCIEWLLEGLKNSDKVERVAAEQPLKDFVDSFSRASKSFKSWQVFTSVCDDELQTFWTIL